jgi:hypothetical protein
MNQWHSAPPPAIAQTLRDALMWHAGESRYAFGRIGVRRVVSISPNATGEPSLGVSPAGAGLMSVSALKNVPGVVPSASLTGLSSFTAVIAFPFPFPSSVSTDARYWSFANSNIPAFRGYRTSPYFLAWEVGYGADNSLNAAMQNSAGVQVNTTYRSVPFNAADVPKGPVVVALTWNAGEIPMVRALSRTGRVWCSGNVGATALSGTVTISTTPWPFLGQYTPDGDNGISIPPLFNGVWDRALSVRELGALAKQIGDMNRPTPVLPTRIGTSLAQTLRSVDGLRARTETNNATLRVRLG